VDPRLQQAHFLKGGGFPIVALLLPFKHLLNVTSGNKKERRCTKYVKRVQGDKPETPEYMCTDTLLTHTRAAAFLHVCECVSVWAIT